MTILDAWYDQPDEMLEALRAAETLYLGVTLTNVMRTDKDDVKTVEWHLTLVQEIPDGEGE